MAAGVSEEDDETLNLRIQCQEPDAVGLLLMRFGPRAKGYLKKHYGGVLCDADIDAAIHGAAARAWKYGHSFDPRRSLKSWFLRIVQLQAIDIINDNSGHQGVEFDLAVHDRPDECDEPVDKRTKRRLDDLADCIEKLEGNQKAIIKADLSSSDVAGAARLAELLGSTINSIYVSRRKARENLRKCVTERESQRGTKGGKL